MHVIARKRLNDFDQVHSDCAASLVHWFKEMRGGRFPSIQEIRSDLRALNRG